MTDTPERGDVIVFEKQVSFPQTGTRECRGVVEEVHDDHLECGMDGRISLDQVVEVQGKSPDYGAETDTFETTVVN